MSCQERRAHLEASHDSKLIESKVNAKAALDQAGAVRARPLVERREDGAIKRNGEIGPARALMRIGGVHSLGLLCGVFRHAPTPRARGACSRHVR